MKQITLDEFFALKKANPPYRDPEIELEPEIALFEVTTTLEHFEWWEDYLKRPTAPVNLPKLPVLEAPKGKSREIRAMFDSTDLTYLALLRSKHPWIKTEAAALRYAVMVLATTKPPKA